jgi:hypothetical protein
MEGDADAEPPSGSVWLSISLDDVCDKRKGNCFGVSLKESVAILSIEDPCVVEVQVR